MINSVDKKIKFIFIIVFFTIFLIGMLYYLIFEDGYSNMNLLQSQYSTCQTFLNSSEKEKATLKVEYSEAFDLSDETCNEIVKYDVSPASVFYLYENTISSRIISIFIPFFIPIIIIFPYIYIITKKLRSNEIKNYLLRDNFENYRKRLFKIAYSNILIVPLLLLLIFIISLIISKNVNPTADVNFLLVQPKIIDNYNNPMFYLLYSLIIFLNIGLYNNIALIVMSKNKNFLISFIESFLLIYLVWCISEILFGNILNLFQISSHNASLLEMYKWAGIDNMLVYFIVNTFWFILSLLIMIICYKNKEKIIKMCES